jgi:hypothetical protein
MVKQKGAIVCAHCNMFIGYGLYDAKEELFTIPSASFYRNGRFDIIRLSDMDHGHDLLAHVKKKIFAVKLY